MGSMARAAEVFCQIQNRIRILVFNKMMGRNVASKLVVLLVLVICSNAKDNRNAKEFSLFSVVTFKNEECTSDTSIKVATGSSTTRTGTCYTSSECSDKSGTVSGNCASGFGVCCIFLSTTGASATISENRTHLRNYEYPTYATSTAAKTIIYTVKKTSDDICQLRLDFENFVIAGPSNSKQNIPNVARGHCTNDYMTIVSSGSDFEVTPICGMITGEHIYVDMGMATTDTTLITIVTAISTSVGPTIAQRLWDIKTSQIPCYASYRAPEGCHRYLTADVGKIASFNFRMASTTAPTTQSSTAGQNTGVELEGQRVNTCIRRAKGMCCVQYQVCISYNSIALTDTTGVAVDAVEGLGGVYNEGWSIDVDQTPYIIDDTQTNLGAVDAICSEDYVEIPSSFSAPCGMNHGGGAGQLNTRYCGSKFGANMPLAEGASTTIMGSTSTPVCDCSEPFQVTHWSNLLNDQTASATNMADTTIQVMGRGFCLDYVQSPCNF